MKTAGRTRGGPLGKWDRSQISQTHELLTPLQCGVRWKYAKQGQVGVLVLISDLALSDTDLLAVCVARACAQIQRTAFARLHIQSQKTREDFFRLAITNANENTTTVKKIRLSWLQLINRIGAAHWVVIVNIAPNGGSSS